MLVDGLVGQRSPVHVSEWDSLPAFQVVCRSAAEWAFLDFLIGHAKLSRKVRQKGGPPQRAMLELLASDQLAISPASIRGSQMKEVLSVYGRVLKWVVSPPKPARFSFWCPFKPTFIGWPQGRATHCS